MQVMGLEGVTAAPGHAQPVPRASGVLSQGYLEETPLPDTAAPAEMKRPFSPRPFSLPVLTPCMVLAQSGQHFSLLQTASPTCSSCRDLP